MKIGGISSQQAGRFQHSGVIEVANSLQVNAKEFQNTRTIYAGDTAIDAEKLINSGTWYLKENSKIAVKRGLDIKTGKIIGEKKIDLHLPQSIEKFENSIKAENWFMSTSLIHRLR